MNFGVLFRYECKKLFRRKLVWACLGVMLAMSLLTGFLLGRGSTHSYNGIEIDGARIQELTRQSKQDLVGRTIDDAMLREILASEAITADTVPNNRTELEQFLEENLGYSSLYTWMERIMGQVPEHLTADQFYAARRAVLEEEWAQSGLSEGERAWWRQREAQVAKPFVYDDTSPWSGLSNIIYSINIMGMLLLAICLPGIFSEEHTRRTDQLLLAAPLGKKLYRVKLLLGTVFGFGTFVLFLICGAVPAVMASGIEGFSGAIQLLLPKYAMNLSVGEMTLIMAGLLLVSSILNSVFAMVMAEMLHSGIAATALLTALALLGDLVRVPYAVRWREELVSYLPGQLVTVWEAFDVRLFSFFGTYLAPWQAGPILWAAAILLLALLGKWVYGRYQISGR